MTSTLHVPTNDLDTMLPDTPPQSGRCANAMFAECFSATSKIFTDQTGRFPHTSTVENNGVIVLYDFNSNYVNVEVMPLRA